MFEHGHGVEYDPKVHTEHADSPKQLVVLLLPLQLSSCSELPEIRSMGMPLCFSSTDKELLNLLCVWAQFRFILYAFQEDPDCTWLQLVGCACAQSPGRSGAYGL